MRTFRRMLRQLVVSEVKLLEAAHGAHDRWQRLDPVARGRALMHRQQALKLLVYA